MTLYLSAPMTGIKDMNRPAMLAAEKALQRAGYKVINPARLPPGKTWTWYMQRALKGVEKAYGVATLPGWSDSNGCQIERHVTIFHKKAFAPLKTWIWLATGGEL